VENAEAAERGAPYVAEPLYRRVAKRISDGIASNDLPRRGRLPSERELCASYSISRVTLRQALSLLAQQGLITAHAGRGWFVSDALSEPPGALLSFTEMATSRGLTVTSMVLVHEVRPATIDEAEALATTPGVSVLDVVRLRLVEDVATAIDRSLLRLGLMEGIDQVDFSKESLHATLIEVYEIVPTRADYSLEAGAATALQARHLGVPVGAPVLNTRQTTFDQHGRPVELNEMTYRGDRYRMRATLTAPTRGGEPAVHALVPQSAPSTYPAGLGSSGAGIHRTQPWT
jgi:GntR family transcriptional regulator